MENEWDGWNTELQNKTGDSMEKNKRKEKKEAEWMEIARFGFHLHW